MRLSMNATKGSLEYSTDATAPKNDQWNEPVPSETICLSFQMVGLFGPMSFCRGFNERHGFHVDDVSSAPANVTDNIAELLGNWRKQWRCPASDHTIGPIMLLENEPRKRRSKRCGAVWAEMVGFDRHLRNFGHFFVSKVSWARGSPTCTLTSG